MCLTWHRVHLMSISCRKFTNEAVQGCLRAHHTLCLSTPLPSPGEACPQFASPAIEHSRNSHPRVTVIVLGPSMHTFCGCLPGSAACPSISVAAPVTSLICVCVYYCGTYYTVCLLLQYLLQRCSRGGRGIVEDMCYERRRAEAWWTDHGLVSLLVTH